MKLSRQFPRILLAIAIALVATACDERDGRGGSGIDDGPGVTPANLTTNALTDPNVVIVPPPPPPTRSEDLDSRRPGNPGSPGGGSEDPVDPPVPTPPTPPGPDVLRGNRTHLTTDWTVDFPPDGPPPPPEPTPSPRPEKRLTTPRGPLGSPGGLDVRTQGVSGGGGTNGEEPVPEPSTVILFLVGVAAAGILYIRKK